jgi:hypothetical protein
MRLIAFAVIFGVHLSWFSARVHAQVPLAQVVIDPAASFLLVTNDPAPAAVPIDLGALGLQPGNIILLSETGQWNNGSGKYLTIMIGAFSSNSVLLASNQLNRIPGAIGIGRTLATPPSFFGSIPTSIPQTFEIPTNYLSVRVPPGAAYLFAASDDSFFSDNFQNTTNPFSLLIAAGTEAILTAALNASNSLTISWNSDSNQWYQLQTTAPLLNVWTNVGDPILGTGSLTQQVVVPFIGQDAFYRMERVP